MSVHKVSSQLYKYTPDVYVVISTLYSPFKLIACHKLELRYSYEILQYLHLLTDNHSLDVVGVVGAIRLTLRVILVDLFSCSIRSKWRE